MMAAAQEEPNHYPPTNHLMPNNDSTKVLIDYYERCIPIPYDRIINGQKFISYYSLAHYLRNPELQKSFLAQYSSDWISYSTPVKADMNLNLILNNIILNDTLNNISI